MTQAPERRGTPFGAGRDAFAEVIGEARAHVVQQQIGVGMNGLAAQFGQRVVVTGGHRGPVTARAADIGKQGFAGRVAVVAACTDAEQG